MSNVLDIPFDDMDGNSQTLRKLGGQSTDTWLVVNVASACGLTKQYADLQKLWETYKDKAVSYTHLTLPTKRIV